MCDMSCSLLQGVVKALREQGLLPRVIAGSSVGSIGKAAPAISHMTAFKLDQKYTPGRCLLTAIKMQWNFPQRATF